MPISESGTMADVKITGYEGDYYANEVYCSKLDTFGRSETLMYWLDLAEYDDGTTVWPAQYGWWDVAGAIEYNAQPLDAGEGLWLKSPSDAFKVQCSGEVISESLPVALINGNQLCSNPTPVTFDMGEVWITGYEGDYYANEVYCSKLDTFGRSETLMYWLDLAEFDDGTTVWPAQYGWWDVAGAIEYNTADDIAPGEALWVKAPSTAFTLNWPNPLVAE